MILVRNAMKTETTYITGFVSSSSSLKNLGNKVKNMHVIMKN